MADECAFEQPPAPGGLRRQVIRRCRTKMTNAAGRDFIVEPGPGRVMFVLVPRGWAASLASIMNRTQWHRIILLSTGLLTVMPVTCNSIFAKRSPTADDGYEYVTVSGSRIPQRVKKGSAVTTTSPVDVMSAESLRNYTQKHVNVTK